ncbi:MAG TPA: hypothetical protein VF618_23895 [Thermoanaerobaculia bacterium]
MRRNAFDAIRRGFENTVANWPLLLLRVGETLLFAALTVAAIIAVLIPLAVSLGVKPLRTPEDFVDLASIVLEHWLVLVWIIVAALLLSLVFVLVHSFLQAGSARVYLNGPFTMERFLAGGKEGWWRVFWIYNLAWGVAGLIVVLPMLPVMALVTMIADEPAAAAGIGCLGLVFTFMLALGVTIITAMWVEKAIVIALARHTTARAALSAGWKDVKGDFARHLVVALIVFAVSFAVSSAVSTMVWVGGALHSPDSINILFSPLQFFSYGAQMLISSAVSAWFLASYAALLEE